MPQVKKKAKKVAAKKVAASAKGYAQPTQKKTITDVIKFLRDNPDYAIAFHRHFADKVAELNRAGWRCGNSHADQKHCWGAQAITSEILDDFNFYDLIYK